MGLETDRLVACVKDQFARVWDTWDALVRSIPDEAWSRGDIDYLIPARHLVHVVVFADAFIGEIPLDGYDGLQLFGVGEWGTPPEQLPSRETALDRLAAIRKVVDDQLMTLGAVDLLAPETTHPWTGQTRLDKMNAELVRRGSDGVKHWI